MSSKIGRNDRCPCGSGKKYKHCCGQPAAAPATAPADTHKGAVTQAINWLVQHHRKGFATAMQSALDDAVLEVVEDDEEAARDAMAKLDADVFGALQINLAEWLLAEGDMQVLGKQQRVSDLLLGPNGPQLSSCQRAWLAQMARRSLRLYDVTGVVPGVSLTVCDALATDQPPVVVNERTGSQSLKAGMQLGARVMEVDGHHELSGAVYPFSTWAGRDVQARLRAQAASPNQHEEDDVLMAGLTIIDGWLAQYLLDEPLPDLVDKISGEPLVYIADHYTVRDWAALTAALAAQPDVEGNREAGWVRLREGADGPTRALAMIISAEADDQRVVVTYRTAQMAGQGRAWFDALAGLAVKSERREQTDPGTFNSPAGASMTAPQIDAESMTGLIETTIRRIYANWTDEPIPVLEDRTPRQAMQSAAGLERVKGLLRSYEDGEAEQAAQNGRRAVSYQFLWDALGLQR